MRPARTIALLLLSLTFSPCVVWGGSITYNLQSYPSLQNTDTLTGTITTDGKTGNITGSDILSWSYTIRTAGGSLVDQESGTSSDLFTVTGLTATSTMLTLPTGPQNDLTFAPLNNLALLGYGRIQGVSDQYEAVTATASVIWDTIASVPPGLSLGSDPWVIAVAGATVPEPGSFTLALLGGACLAVVHWTR